MKPFYDGSGVYFANLAKRAERGKKPVKSAMFWANFALETDRTDPYVLNEVAWQCFRTNEFERAYTYAQQALEQNPNLWRCLMILACIEFDNAKQNMKALNHLQQAQALRPNDPLISAFITHIYLTMHAWSDGINSLDKDQKIIQAKVETANRLRRRKTMRTGWIFKRRRSMRRRLLYKLLQRQSRDYQILSHVAQHRYRSAYQIMRFDEVQIGLVQSWKYWLLSIKCTAHAFVALVFPIPR
jgi:tetratricopeptide (TPR) repeat protein